MSRVDVVCVAACVIVVAIVLGWLIQKSEECEQRRCPGAQHAELLGGWRAREWRCLCVQEPEASP